MFLASFSGLLIEVSIGFNSSPGPYIHQVALSYIGAFTIGPI